MRGTDKIDADHLGRTATVYIRQSTEFQMRHNVYSQERQYQLADLGVELGWQRERIEVIDEDLGHSASAGSDRDGFSRLRRDVAEGRIGVILCVEASRLARSNREWYHLLDLCGICGTLLVEPGAIYDPRDYDDRLHLGLKGILSEAELHLLRTRLSAGLKLKAEKGELITSLPVGYVKDADGRIAMDPDQEVQAVLRSIFEEFPNRGSVLGVYKWMLAEGVQHPKRVGEGLLSEVVWQRPTYRAVHRVITTPTYAGAYVFGRRKSVVEISGEEPRRVRRDLPMEKWPVLIEDAHQGYISWEQYLKNQERVKVNWNGGGRGSAAGRGPALVQGILRCRRCGGRMQIKYRKKPASDGVEYVDGSYICTRAKNQLGVSVCQMVSVAKVDHIIREIFLEAMAPAQIEASFEALDQIDVELARAQKHWELRLERTRYEVDRARRQYDRVEPENRIVARELETRWNQKAEELQKLEDEYRRWQNNQPERLSSAELEAVRGLVENVCTVWDAPSTSYKDRKQLLRILVEEVWVDADRDRRRLMVTILWHGNTQTVHEVPWSPHGPAPQYDVLDLTMRWVAEGLSDHEIAERLNDKGITPRLGGVFNATRIAGLRSRYKIESPWSGQAAPGPREDGWCTMPEAVQRLGMGSGSIRRLIELDELSAKKSENDCHWWVQVTDEDVRRVHGDWNPEHEVSVTDAARAYGVPLQTVYSWIRKGWLDARKAKVRGRHRLAIPRQALAKTPTKPPRDASGAKGDWDVNHEVSVAEAAGNPRSAEGNGVHLDPDGAARGPEDQDGT